MSDTSTSRISAAVARIKEAPRFSVAGKVTRVVGSIIEASTLEVGIGDLCRVSGKSDDTVAEVVGFHERGVVLMPFGDLSGITPGAPVAPIGRKPAVTVGDELVGRILDGMGRPMDGGGAIRAEQRYPLAADPPNPLERARIDEPLGTGLRVIDGLLTLGRGQRIGVFSGSGVGKSVLMGMIARHTEADLNVIALLGERGREVREFLERDLGAKGLERSVIVVATSDQPALVRANGALVATAIAEYFRDCGKHVMLMMDSVTRVAMALREVGLSVGEPPTTKGYPPSVFASLAKLLERTGSGRCGSISALYTVLVEGDDFNEPVSDAVRGVLDGHIVLSRKLASSGHFPAVDILESISRVRDSVIESQHLDAARMFLASFAAYADAEDLLSVGAYQSGADKLVDRAIELRPDVLRFLRQTPEQKSSFVETRNQLVELGVRLHSDVAVNV